MGLQFIMNSTRLFIILVYSLHCIVYIMNRVYNVQHEEVVQKTLITPLKSKESIGYFVSKQFLGHHLYYVYISEGILEGYCSQSVLIYCIQDANGVQTRVGMYSVYTVHHLCTTCARKQMYKFIIVHANCTVLQIFSWLNFF